MSTKRVTDWDCCNSAPIQADFIRGATVVVTTGGRYAGYFSFARSDDRESHFQVTLKENHAAAKTRFTPPKFSLSSDSAPPPTNVPQGLFEIDSTGPPEAARQEPYSDAGKVTKLVWNFSYVTTVTCSRYLATSTLGGSSWFL